MQVRSLAIMRTLALLPGLLAVQTVLLTRSHAALTDPARLERAIYIAATVPACLGALPSLQHSRHFISALGSGGGSLSEKAPINGYGAL